MSKDTIKSLIEMVDERPNMDNSSVFERLWAVLAELRAKIDARFVLQSDASSADLQPYSNTDGSAKGFLSTFSGPEIDWLVHSNIGTPTSSFTNMHLTAWLGPQIRVPHLGMALGTVPDLFFYMDYIPRVDLFTDLAYLDRYYEPVNARYLELRADERLSPFTSKALYMRQSQSHTSMCYVTKASDEALALVRVLGHEMVDRWLKWVDEAESTPVEERKALAERDLLIRRAIAERDPANPIGVRLFGQEFADRLVRTLWGGDRVNPRAGV